MAIERAIQFNSPLWQIENYSLVLSLGTINSARRQAALQSGNFVIYERIFLVSSSKIESRTQRFNETSLNSFCIRHMWPRY